MLFSIILGTNTALAADESAEFESNGVITFEPDTDPTDPVNPLDPTNPVEPVDPTNPDGPNEGTSGPLSIDFASSFQFGPQKITTVTKNYYAQLQTFKDGTSAPNYVQVTDKRGTQEGWTLAVTQNGQFKTADDEELEGAVLTLANGTSASIMDDAYKPTLVSNNTLTPGTEATLMTAEKGKGMGTWIYRFGADSAEGATSVRLSVPGKSVKLAKEYQTTLTWNLKSVPENTENDTNSNADSNPDEV